MRIEKKGLVYIRTGKNGYPNNHEKKVDNRLSAYADTNPVMPVKAELSARDARKLSKLITVMAYNLNDKVQYLGTSARVKSVCNVIEKIGKLKAGALDDRDLLQSITAELWRLYARIETKGMDDAHFSENLPCDDRQTLNPNGKRGAQGVVFHNGRKGADNRKTGFKSSEKWKRIMPDSKYPDPLDQYALLSLCEKLTRGEMMFAPVIGDVDVTACRLSSKPLSHISGIETGKRLDVPVWAPARHIKDASTMGTVWRNCKGLPQYAVNSTSIIDEPLSYAEKRMLVRRRQEAIARYIAGA